MKLSIKLALIVAVIGAAPLGVEAATSRSNVVKLHGPTVKLSDLFDNLAPGQDCEIGPSPAVGRRLAVPAIQISAIASQFGVDLQPNSAHQAIYIERASRTIRRDEIIETIRPALIAAGMEPDVGISLGVFNAPMVADDPADTPTVVALDYDKPTGRFSSSIQYAAGSENPQQVRVVGHVDEMIDALILVRPVAAGSAIGATDVAIDRIRKPSDRSAVLKDMSALSGAVTRQNLSAGMPLRQDQLVRNNLVGRNRPVVLKLTGGGLALTATGVALDDGGNGDRIRVMNGTTRAVLLGTVSSNAEVTIDPGTLPVSLAQNGSTFPSPRLGGSPAGSAEKHPPVVISP